LKELHQDKPFACSWEGCDKRFAKRDQLKRHAVTHTSDKPHACTFEGCELRFKYPSALKKHMETHAEQHCGFEGCNATFMGAKELRQHIKDEHPRKRSDAVARFPCTICEKKFKTKQHLQTHIKIHDPDREMFKCHLCDKDFTTTANLGVHLRTAHQIIKRKEGEEEDSLSVIIQHQCTTCNKTFKHKHLLVRHKRTHQDMEGEGDQLDDRPNKRMKVSHNEDENKDENKNKNNKKNTNNKNNKSDVLTNLLGPLTLTPVSVVTDEQEVEEEDEEVEGGGEVKRAGDGALQDSCLEMSEEMTELK
jgi:general transcription factor IIIA